MKIYILSAWDLECFCTLGVYSTQEALLAAQAEYAKSAEYEYATLYTVFDLDAPPRESGVETVRISNGEMFDK